ncbi:MAG: acetyl-CoA acetyltransferase [Myxococcota bacterium]
MDPRTPVLVGVGTAMQRGDDPNQAREPVALMVEALLRAADDAECPALLRRADSIRVPRGIWPYRDPARIIADALGAGSARTQLAQIGVLQTALLGGAARDILESRCDVVLVAGGEAKWRSLTARKRGVEERLTRQPEAVAPDEELAPDRAIMHPLEIELELTRPVRQYAMVETALRHAAQSTPEAHARRMATLWAGMSRVASRNPDAWRRDAVSAEQILDLSDGNRMLAYPYTVLLNSQWNVDQAAGLILCALGVVRSLGLDESRLVYPLAVAESNCALTLAERADPASCPGFALAAQRALSQAGLSLADVTHLELYSCFPAAVQVQLRELGLSAERPLTVTGGMAFAGGPLNNFVLQAVAKMAQVLRADPGSRGLVTAVSAVLTKQGVSLWSSSEPTAPFAYADVSAQVATQWRAVDVVAGARGRARVAGYTVVHDHAGPSRAIALCDLDSGGRSLAFSTDPELMAEMESSEFCGRAVQVDEREFSAA